MPNTAPGVKCALQSCGMFCRKRGGKRLQPARRHACFQTPDDCATDGWQAVYSIAGQDFE